MKSLYATETPAHGIRADLIAIKLHAVAGLRLPEIQEQLSKQRRFVELLWFLQSVSLQPGGLPAFVAEFIAAHPSELRTVGLQKVGEGKLRLKVSDLKPLLEEIPNRSRGVLSSGSLLDMLAALPIGEQPITMLEQIEMEGDARDRLLNENNLPYLRKLCEDGVANLVEFLEALCHEKERIFTPPWYFPRLFDCLFAWMDARACDVAEKIANTEVTAKIFDALDFAWSERVLVRIEGDSRFGKTEMIRAWCRMHPGRARVVAVPCCNTDLGFFRAIADALGIFYAPHTKAMELKSQIEYILKTDSLGLMLHV